jgi:hypothetical protein
MSGFKECVANAWTKPVSAAHNPMATLHIKLNRSAKVLSSWSKGILSQAKIAMEVCREVIAQLDKAQEDRYLTAEERALIHLLKARLLGLAAIEKGRMRQRSRITWIKKGDANTKFFHIMTNNRKMKNFIHSLQTENGLMTTQEAKHEAIYSHFQKHIGTSIPRSCSLNYDELRWQTTNLDHLELPFLEEAFSISKLAPKEKAPGPDGYIGLFFSACWDLVKGDLLRAAQQFFMMNQQNLQFLN